eukprot:tig00020554_g10803.t1
MPAPASSAQGALERPGGFASPERAPRGDALDLSDFPAGVVEYTSSAPSERSGKLVNALSKAQIGSMEVVELLVAKGRVHVNGSPVTDTAAIVEVTDRIVVNGEFLEPERDEPDNDDEDYDDADDWDPRNRGKLPKEYSSSIDGGFFKRKLMEVKNGTSGSS